MVNNAGLQYVAPVVEFPEERWNLLIGVMLTGAFLCSKYSLPHMIKQKWGRIINIASLHGKVASPFKVAYISAKHGVMGLTKVVALEQAENGITCNAICPAYVRTPLVEKQIADQAIANGISEEEVVQKIMLEPAAIKRLLEPSEVASAGASTSARTKPQVSPARRWTLIWAGWRARTRCFKACRKARLHNSQGELLCLPIL